jgi:uncharacterized protein YndB with AHSA1/START domain
MKTAPFIIERLLDAPASKVWRALTDKNEMKQWYFDLKDFRPEVGFTFEFYGGTKEHQYLHLCKVTAAEREKKLTYSWKYDGYEGESFVTFELYAEGDRTRLKLTHEGLDTFPDNPDFAQKNFEMGWTDIIGRSLPEYLAKTK